jgi:hypothetical protein
MRLKENLLNTNFNIFSNPTKVIMSEEDAGIKFW